MIVRRLENRMHNGSSFFFVACGKSCEFNITLPSLVLYKVDWKGINRKERRGDEILQNIFTGYSHALTLPLVSVSWENHCFTKSFDENLTWITNEVESLLEYERIAVKKWKKAFDIHTCCGLISRKKSTRFVSHGKFSIYKTYYVFIWTSIIHTTQHFGRVTTVFY